MKETNEQIMCRIISNPNAAAMILKALQMKDQELEAALQARDSKAVEDLDFLRLRVISKCQNIALPSP